MRDAVHVRVHGDALHDAEAHVEHELAVEALERVRHRLGAAAPRERERGGLPLGEARWGRPQLVQEGGRQGANGLGYGKIHLGSSFPRIHDNSKVKGGPSLCSNQQKRYAAHLLLFNLNKLDMTGDLT